MNRPLSRVFTSLVILLAGSLSALTQAQTAQIPASFHGTYSLTFETDNPQAPLPDGATAQLVLAPGGALCIADYILTDPQLESGNSAEAFWTAGDAGVRLALSDISGPFSEINVLALDGSFLGQMTGTKISDSTTCGSLNEVPPNIEEIDDVFSLAEQAFADLFPTAVSDASLRVLDGFIYRHYEGSGAFIGINNDTVYLMGGPFGDQPESVGSISGVLDQLYIELGMEPPGGGDNPGDMPDGEFTLTVSGSASGTMEGVPFDQQFDPLFVIDSVASPDSGDLQAMEDQLIAQLQESMESVESDAVSNVVISEETVEEDRVFFNVTFDVDTSDPPMSLNYDLDYEFIRN